MNQEQLKYAAAKAAIDYIRPKLSKNAIIGVGTGSTANFFIDLLAEIKGSFASTVASSSATAERLNAHGITVCDLNEVDELSVYVDGADESDPQLALIKGGGAALTREKIVAFYLNGSRFADLHDLRPSAGKKGAPAAPLGREKRAAKKGRRDLPEPRRHR